MRYLFRNVTEIKGPFHGNMAIIKDKYLLEKYYIKITQNEHMEELDKKGPQINSMYDALITEGEPDILKNKVRKYC